MGAKFSYSSLSTEDQAHVPSFYAVGLLESEVGELYSIYTRWVNSKTHILTLNDMMAHLHSRVTPYVRKIFDVEDVNAATENIPFHLFALGLWNYCTLDEFDLVTYIFNMYDTDNEGVIDVVTCKMLIKQLYGDTSLYETSPGAEKCFEELSKSRAKAEYIDLAFLVKFSRNCPAFLHPALIFKSLCIELTLGSKFWGKKLQDRKEANKYSFVSKELLIKRASRRNIEEPPLSNRQPDQRQQAQSPTPTNTPFVSLFRGGGGGGKSAKHISAQQSPSRRGSGSEHRLGGGQGSSSFSGEGSGGGSLLDQISSLFGKGGGKPAPEEQAPSTASRRAKKQKPIAISRVSSRTLTYGGGSAKHVKPTTKKPVQVRKIHVYGFYKEDGSAQES